MDDWLEDPLAVRKKGSLKYKQPKSLQENTRQNWKTFHFSTRLKLEAADHFCRLAIGAASVPYDFGLPTLAYSQIKWYLDAFFFELISAYDTLLQEINVVYAVNLNIENVKWKSMRNELPIPLVDLMEGQWEATWFKRLRWYRNTATHHAYIPIGASTGGWREKPFDYEHHEVTLWHFDSDTNQWMPEDIKKACPKYLKKMAAHIRAVWRTMADKFD